MFLPARDSRHLQHNTGEMSTFRLPYDVLDNVFLYLDGRSLVSACLVNKFFNIPASRALYGREINLDPWKSKVSIVIQLTLEY